MYRADQINPSIKSSFFSQPLKMKDSCFYLNEDDAERIERLAQVYEADENENVTPSELALQRRRWGYLYLYI